MSLLSPQSPPSYLATPSTRLTTRMQRRAEPFAPRRRNARGNEENRPAPLSETVPAATVASGSSQLLSTAVIQDIASAVSSAVVAPLQPTVEGPQREVQARSPQQEIQVRGPQQEVQELPLVARGMSEADATVQGPVAPVLDSLTGERHDIHVASPVSNLLNFNSISIPIDAQVNPKLKAKIWANEFIEFGSLLKRGISEPSYHIAVRSGSVSQSSPTLSLEPTTKSRPISNVETWTTAFQIFVGIYTSKFPLEAPSLMKYGS